MWIYLPNLCKHWEATLRVVCYLKGSPSQDILLRDDGDLHMFAWYDSEWASCSLTRWSLIGWFILLDSSPVYWKTKKQHIKSRSFVEVEYHFIATTNCELKWLKAILLCVGVTHSWPMQLYCDSQVALHIAANPIFHEHI